ncbi:glycoside hydrolase family 47 protein [Lasiosphaeris hirsuta]|uniref:alpha-1,2-Mannosidase n=1 Tax=Lasiosphaeris hirsuta TaxID=260670 RepID=A0AA40AI19_9PEZI|nr:glycoside hydrolase family 47 protein [Lasiosphaeris hirsuta]
MQRPLRAFAPRSRNLLVAVVFCLIFFYLLRWSDNHGHVTLESAALERHMNSGPLSHPLTLVKSSVDWGNVEYRYPAQEPLTPVPAPPAKPLPRVQHQFGPESTRTSRVREGRRKAVKDLTVKSWNAYRKYAWKQDALLPLSARGRDQFSGWAATLVDSLDTLWMMGLRDEFDEAVAAVAQIDFGNSTAPQVNIFETNIRYLGGLMAAYDLSKREVLLQKAIELGDLIYGGFNTANRMPVDSIAFDAAKAGTGLHVEEQVVSASPGTLSLEMTRLSQLTGNPKYYDAIVKVTDLFHRGQNSTRLPGLFPMFVSMLNKNVVAGGDFTLAGCADSLYEYFPKMHALLSGAVPQYRDLTLGFIAAAKKHIFFRPMIPEDDVDILIAGNVRVANDNVPVLDPESEHLACFIGGTVALAGRLLEREEDVQVGARLARGCAYAYRSFPTGVMPERFNMVPCREGACKWDEERWVEERQKRPEWKAHLPKGFTTAKDPRYILRPEAIESVFYMWRITGEEEWSETAWDMFVAVANATATDVAAAAVRDVTVAREFVAWEDYMESFWIAETLKYFYLAFSPPDLISLDKYVLNTEAHPFLRP